MIFKVPPVCNTEKALDLKLITIPLSHKHPFKKVDPAIIESNKTALSLLLRKVLLLEKNATAKSYDAAYYGFKGAYIVPVKVRILPRKKDFLSEQPESRKADIIKFSREITDEWDKPIFILSDIVSDVKGEVFLVDGARRINARALRNEQEIFAELMVSEEYILKEIIEMKSLHLKKYGKEYFIRECDDTNNISFYEPHQIIDLLKDFIKKHEKTESRKYTSTKREPKYTKRERNSTRREPKYTKRERNSTRRVNNK